MFRNTFTEINLSHLLENFRSLKKLQNNGSFICPMVKANAYGHGAVEVSIALQEEGVESLGVAMVEEGIQLRQGGVKEPAILVFGGFQSQSVPALLEYSLTPVISSWDHIKVLEDNLLKAKPIEVHLMLNTGMNRLGFSCKDAAELNKYFKASECFVLKGICTHFANAGDIRQKDSTAQTQMQQFLEAVKDFSVEVVRHALSSEALLLSAKDERELGARPGIALYGALPHADLKPVLRWVSEIIAYQDLDSGESLSYGWTWTAKRKSIIGIVAVGYADGYRRILSNCGKVLYRGKKVSVVGTVCMDYILVDLTEVLGEEKGNVGEEVVLIGQQGDQEITASDLADWARTISYEILTGISGRVPQKFTR